MWTQMLLNMLHINLCGKHQPYLFAVILGKDVCVNAFTYLHMRFLMKLFKFSKKWNNMQWKILLQS